MFRLLVTVGMLALLVPQVASGVVIDSFTQAIPFLTTGINLDAGGYLSSRRVGVIGGSAAGGLDAIEGLVVIDLQGGVAAEVLWPDIGGTPDVDVTDGGLDTHFELDIGAIAGTWIASLTADDGIVAASSVIAGIIAPGTLSFPFSDFAGVDLTSLDSVRLLLVNVAGIGDAITATELRTVPEPHTAALFAAGLLGLVLAGKKR